VTAYGKRPGVWWRHYRETVQSIQGDGREVAVHVGGGNLHIDGFRGDDPVEQWTLGGPDHVWFDGLYSGLLADISRQRVWQVADRIARYSLRRDIGLGMSPVPEPSMQIVSDVIATPWEWKIGTVPPKDVIDAGHEAYVDIVGAQANMNVLRAWAELYPIPEYAPVPIIDQRGGGWSRVVEMVEFAHAHLAGGEA